MSDWDTIAELHKTARAYERSRQAHDAKTQAFHTAIRAAADAGVSYRRIAEEVGGIINFQRVAQIVGKK